MCHDFSRGFCGWCKSFTTAERWLTLLEALLLVVFLALFTFIFIHMLFCPQVTNKADPFETTTSSSTIHTTEHDGNKTVSPTNGTSRHTTLDPKIKCTWSPSHKTSSVTRYFEQSTTVTKILTKETLNEEHTESGIFAGIVTYSDHSDGEEIQDETKSLVLALVKVHTSRDITFGCTLSAVSRRWLVSAASCVETAEDLASLDTYVIMERYGEPQAGRTHAIADVRIHPDYDSHNKTYDIVALKSDDAVLEEDVLPFQIATLIDYYSSTIGESFSIMGFGRFRTVETSSAGRTSRVARVWRVQGAACARSGGWAPRHLIPARILAPRAAPLCAGVRHARGTPCHYCAGTPLVRAHTLFGVMSDDGLCAVACEPAAYTNLAHVSRWLTDILQNDP